MNDESAKNGCCPPREALSDMVDGAGTAEVVAHVEHCGDCRGITESYRRVDEAIAGALKAPDELADRIRAACVRHRSLSAPTPVLWWQSRSLRLAAAFAVTGVLLALLSVALRGLDQERIASGSDGEPSEAGLPETPQLVAGQPDGAVDGVNTKPFGGDEVRKVTIPGGRSGSSRASVRPQDDAVVLLPGALRHVWTVRDIGASQTRLKAILGDTPVVAKPSGDGRVSLRMDLEDRQLQKLVNTLSDEKWSLISPDLPQPRKDSHCTFLGRRVSYTLELVETDDE